MPVHKLPGALFAKRFPASSKMPVTRLFPSNFKNAVYLLQKTCARAYRGAGSDRGRLSVRTLFLPIPTLPRANNSFASFRRDSTAIIFLDLDALRQSPFLAKLYAWAPAPSEDSEYSQFVGDSGFSYERDLEHLLLAISNHGPTTDLLAIADGKFDRKKMELILNKNGTASQQGQWTVFHLGSTAEKKAVSDVSLQSANRHY